MTNSDLRNARDELDSRIQGRRSRDRRLVLLAVAVVVATVVGIAGWRALTDDDPASSPDATSSAPDAAGSAVPSELSDADQAFLTGNPPTPELLEGVWRLDNPTDSRMLFLFTVDGDVRYDDTGQLTGDPLVTGTYAIDGDLVSVEVDGGQAGCSGRTMEFRAAMNSGGGVHLVPVDAEPTSCDRPFRHQWVLEQVQPARVFADFVVPPGRRWDPPAGQEALLGTWMAGGANYLIELQADGSFTTLAGAGEVVDRGTWTDTAGTTELTLTSSADSPSCSAGDRFTLSHLRAGDVGTVAIQGDLERNDCDLAPWLGWFLLAP
jgi:hypothetical protein